MQSVLRMYWYTYTIRFVKYEIELLWEKINIANKLCALCSHISNATGYTQSAWHISRGALTFLCLTFSNFYAFKGKYQDY